ncbi:outer membrane efflux protein [Alkalilimnicola ehrlichii MLHE-1]|uniref:Outer membrane efflux protein n=1 Tax=Alkalilimnicola ehrlichii (strain ATCC BAA-1101 / DSM 17681 / MLHE-1) TaxID=187272 RepID=Q0A6M7_ALKEH|nr:outer membrane efflux protein [Alkalilimnicola ehrlichii MLHE-1]
MGRRYPHRAVALSLAAGLGGLAAGGMVPPAAAGDALVASPGSAGLGAEAPADGPELVLPDALKAAVGHDPRVAEARAELARRGDEVDMARADRWPQVSASTRSEFNSTLNRHVPVASVTASQRLYDFGEVGGRVDGARAGEVAARAEWQQTVEDVAADAAHAFIQVQRYQALLVVAEEQVAAMSRLEGLIQRRAAMGASTRSDEREVAARVDAARLTRAQVATQLADARRALRRLVPGRYTVAHRAEPPAQLAGACDRVDVEDIDHLPELQAAAARSAEARAGVKAARAARFPTLSLDVTSDRFFDSDVPNQTETSVLLNVRADLFAGGRNRAGQSASRHRLAAAEAAAAGARLDADQRLQQAAEQAAALAERMGVLARRIETLDELRDLHQSQYLRAGTRSLMNLLDVEQDYFQARFDQLDLRHDQKARQVDCLSAVGALGVTFELDDRRPEAIDLPL